MRPHRSEVGCRGLSFVGPERSEFVLAPLVSGTATPFDVSDPDLAYSVEGTPYDPSPYRAPFDVTAALDYSLTLDGDQEPVGQGSDEPAEVPKNGSDPD